jgi:hypothetical protein
MVDYSVLKVSMQRRAFIATTIAAAVTPTSFASPIPASTTTPFASRYTLAQRQRTERILSLSYAWAIETDPEEKQRRMDELDIFILGHKPDRTPLWKNAEPSATV